MNIFQPLEFSEALVALVSERVHLLFVLVGGSFVGPWRVWESSKDSNDGSGDGGDWGVTRWRFMVCVLCVWVVKYLPETNNKTPLKNDAWKRFAGFFFWDQNLGPLFSTLKPGVFVNTGKVRSMMNCLGDDSCKRFGTSPAKQTCGGKKEVCFCAFSSEHSPDFLDSFQLAWNSSNFQIPALLFVTLKKVEAHQAESKTSSKEIYCRM